MSNNTGIETFFQGLAEHLVNQVNGPIRSTFTVGDKVYYQGSKVADHGFWQVVGTNRGTVTIGRPGTSRSLVVNAVSLRHAPDALVPGPTPIPSASVARAEQDLDEAKRLELQAELNLHSAKCCVEKAMWALDQARQAAK